MATPSSQPKPITWEWLAAFFDGEGCIVVKKKNSKYTGDPQIWLQIHQLEASGILLTIREFLQDRSITVYYNTRDSTQGMLQISKRKDVWLMLRRMYPYLHVKRTQTESVLDYFERLREVQMEFGQKYYHWRERLIPPLTATEAKKVM